MINHSVQAFQTALSKARHPPVAVGVKRVVVEVGCGYAAKTAYQLAQSHPDSFFAAVDPQLGIDPVSHGEMELPPQPSNLLLHRGKAAEVLRDLTDQGVVDEILVIAPFIPDQDYQRLKGVSRRAQLPTDDSQSDVAIFRKVLAEKFSVFTYAPEWVPIFHGQMSRYFSRVETLIYAHEGRAVVDRDGTRCLCVRTASLNDFGKFDYLYWPFVEMGTAVVEGQWGSVMGVYGQPEKIVTHVIQRSLAPESNHFSSEQPVFGLTAWVR